MLNPNYPNNLSRVIKLYCDLIKFELNHVEQTGARAHWAERDEIKIEIRNKINVEQTGAWERIAQIKWNKEEMEVEVEIW